MKPSIVVVGTLDTKSNEIGYVRDLLHDFGADVVVVDSGVLGTPTIAADVTRHDVAAAGGHTLAQIQNIGTRGAAVEMMQDGLRVVALRLRAEGRLDGILCLGGAEGGLMGAAAMQVLPIGVPKVIVSPSASGRREFGPFMGSSDITVMHSVIDILGLNAVSKAVFQNAAAAVFGMATLAGSTPSGDRPRVGMTMLGQTTPGAMVIAKRLEAAGYEPIIFHANGVGGPAMDALAADGGLVGVIDFTLSEVANSLFDGIHATGPERMRAAVDAHLPLVVVPGAGDFFNQGPLDSVPDKFRDRALYRHNPVATLVRINADEMRHLADDIADRVNPAGRLAVVIVPTRGLSLIGIPGGPIEDRAADEALVDELRKRLNPAVELTTVDSAINDVDFAHLVADTFLSLIARPSGTDAG